MPPTPSLTVLGIRHHGPGSARSVLGALEEVEPDLLLIEGMPELDDLLPLADRPDLVPPVAGLVYVKDDPRRAVFSPLADFSPEWVALRWATARGVPVRFADLPAVHWLALTEEADDTPDGSDAPVEDTRGVAPARTDPIALLAAAAGYADPERWWDDAVEHRPGSGLAAFAALTDAMAQLRLDGPAADRETLLREAAMRRIVRAALRSGAERVVFVCGAFHAPAVDPGAATVKADSALLTGLPRVRVAATWAPWTAERLALATGYGAGVASPGWYAHLFRTWSGPRPADVVPSWLVRVAGALRDEQLDASTASVVEAARLAEALATLRSRPSVGLEELHDATQAVLADGSPLPLELVHRTMVVGHELGAVPDDAPVVPLAADLAAQQRSLRLRPSATPQTVVLDLRTGPGRARSTLLHRLTLLGVRWGSLTDDGTRTTGTFKEAWDLEWVPELTVAVVVASVHGTTVEDAATDRVRQAAARAEDLEQLGGLVQSCLLASLPEALEDVVERFADQSARQHDTLSLLRSVEPLARTARYGDVRGVGTSRVRGVLDAVVRRVCVGLRPASVALDDDAAAELRSAVEAAHRGIALLDQAELTGPWLAALDEVGSDPQIHGSLTGRATRFLLDAGRVDTQEAGVRMSQRLSVNAPATGAAAWLDGFLSGDVALLLHDRDLLGIVDGWVAQIGEGAFEDLLPLLRRTFSRYQAAERRVLGQHLRGLEGRGRALRDATDHEFDLELALPAVRRMAVLIGLETT